MTSDRFSSPAGADLTGPATPYRMTVTTTLPHREAVALADEQLAAWLKQEGCEEPPPAPRALTGPPPAGPASTGKAPSRPEPPELTPPGLTASGPAQSRPAPVAERLRLGDRVLLDRDRGPLRGGPAAGRYDRRRLRTPTPHGTQQLTLTVATGADGPTWVRLEAETHSTGNGVRTPCRVPVPELARTLLPLLDATDGPAAVHPAPRVITAGEVDGLIDELCDPERRLPVVVASVPVNLPLDRWVEDVVRPLCHQLPGLATAYVLDPGARTGFNVALEYHSVYGGAVRTYLPEVDPASRCDGARHPVLARGRIEQDIRRAAGLLAREPRRLAADLPLPPPLAAVPVLRVAPAPRRGAVSPAGTRSPSVPSWPRSSGRSSRTAPSSRPGPTSWSGSGAPCATSAGTTAWVGTAGTSRTAARVMRAATVRSSASATTVGTAGTATCGPAPVPSPGATASSRAPPGTSPPSRPPGPRSRRPSPNSCPGSTSSRC